VDEVDTPLKCLVLDFEAAGFIDITGTDELGILKEELRERHIELYIMSVSIPVMKVFTTSGFMDRLGVDNLISNRNDAIAILFKRLDHEYCRQTCPYYLFYECHDVK
jgi:SulP family sulfate permease